MTTPRRHSLATLAALGTLLMPTSAAHAQEAPMPEGAVCTVYEQQILRTTFDEHIASARQQYRNGKRPFPAPGSAERRALESDLITYLVARALHREAATQHAITVEESAVDAARADLIKTLGGIAKYRAELRRSATTDERVREDLRHELRSNRLYDAIVADVPAPTSTQVRAEYDRNRAAYRVPRSRTVAHILVRTKQRAVTLRAALLGKPFSAFQRLARRHSLDPSSAKLGGRLTIERGQTVPPFDRVAFSLRTRQLSAPIRTTFGWHLVYAVSPVRPARQKPFAQVRQEIRTMLDERTKDTRYNAWSTAWERESVPSVRCLPSHPWTPVAT